MKQGYKIEGFKVISWDELEAHPDALLPMDAEDSAVLGDSIDEHKVLLPLIVSAELNTNRKHWVYDGVNRFRKSGSVMLPCILAHVPDPRAFALTCLGTGRKRSTGQRVMAYLEMNRDAVLQVAEIVGDGLVPGVRVKRMAGQMTRHEIPKKFEDFTAEAISEKLGVSDKDVKLGIDLMQSEQAAPEAEKQPFQKQRLALLAGGGSIRRWRAAVAGRKADQHGRADVNYADVMERSLKGLRTCLQHWGELRPQDRAWMEGYWAENIVEILPPTMK